MATPSTLSFGTAIGQFLVSASDGVDIDALPDAVPASGTVTFTPSAGVVLDYSTTPNPSAILKDKITCTLDAEGYLVGPNGVRGVKLIATDNPVLQPAGWTWNITYDLKTAEGTRLRTLTSQSILVPAGTTVDLITAMPIAESKGVFITKGEKGVTNIITMGTVTEGPSSAVTLVGESPNQTLNIVLPVMSPEAQALAMAYAIVL